MTDKMSTEKIKLGKASFLTFRNWPTSPIKIFTRHTPQGTVCRWGIALRQQAYIPDAKAFVNNLRRQYDVFFGGQVELRASLPLFVT